MTEPSIPEAPPGHAALELSTAEAVAWSADHPEWWIVPGRLVWDEADEKWLKKPLVPWTKRATNDPEEVRRLWDSERAAGHAAIFVACEPSGIFVIDEDRDPPEDWRKLLDLVVAGRMTRVLLSCTRKRPHYVFKQPHKGDPVGEGKWDGGEVKAAGLIVLSTHEPLVDAPVNYPPAGLLAKLARRPLGSKGRGIATYEALNDWLFDTPEGGPILPEGAQAKFLAKAVERLNKAVDDGEHRRQAALAAVYHSAIESAAGCYEADVAFRTLKDAYADLRYPDEGAKGWTPERESDYDAMWSSLVPEFRAGDHDAAIEEVRDDVLARFDLDDDDFSDLEGWFRTILDATVRAEERSLREEAGPIAGPPEPSAGETPELIDNSVEPEDSDSRTEDSDSRTSHVPVSVSHVPVMSEAGEVVDTETGEILETPPAPPGSGGLFPEIEELTLELHDDAMWGPHGEFIEAVRPHTEADDAGLLAVALACCGAYHGLAAHFVLGSSMHGPTVFVVGVGESATARKTTAWAVMRDVYFPRHGPPLLRPQKYSGMGSGEKLFHCWDPVKVEMYDASGLLVGTKEEPAEPRTVWYEGEVSALFTRAKREGSIMSENVCQIWDQDDLEHHTMSKTVAKVGGDMFRVSLVGMSTLDTIRKVVTDAVVGSGLGNRCLWFYIKDTGPDRDLPEGLPVPAHIMEDYRHKLRLGVTSTGQVPVTLSPEAQELWDTLYGQVKRGQKGVGMVEGLLNRGEAYVLRLALNYHLAVGGPLVAPDGSNRVVSLQALRSALAVWNYCRASTLRIFRGSTGDPTLDEIVRLLDDEGGIMEVSEIRGVGFNPRTVIDRGVESGILRKGVLRRPKGGRPPALVGIEKRVEAGTIVYGGGTTRKLIRDNVSWKKPRQT